MHPGQAGRFATLSLAAILGVATCGDPSVAKDEQAWRAAELAHREGTDGRAYKVWSALDESLPRGKEAHARLRKADEHYRRALALFRAGAPGVREAVQAGIALGPMDPAHYLPFARRFAEQGLYARAADFYRKYLSQDPIPGDSPEVRAELAALEIEEDPFPPTFGAAPAPASSILPIILAGIGGVVAAAGGYWMHRRRGRSLSTLLSRRPEWHPTVAYHLGCLRHEFVKHQVGPLGDSLRALLDGRATEAQGRFLRERGEAGLSLAMAFRAHLGSLERALGLDFTLDHGDPLFAGARRAVQALDGMTWPLPARTRGRLLHAHARLMAFDQSLAGILAGLVRCRLDEAFLNDVLAATRAEYGLDAIELHEVRVGPVPPEVGVDVFRTDMFIVVRNLLRNAIAALADQPGHRRLAVDVGLEMEITGEELVVLRVMDNCPKALPALEAVALDRGLGLVAQVLRRYDGSMRLEPGVDGYAKAVAVRFFRSERPADPTGGEA